MALNLALPLPAARPGTRRPGVLRARAGVRAAAPAQMTLDQVKQVEMGNEALRAELSELDSVEEAIYASLLQENEFLRKLALPKIKLMPEATRVSVLERYGALIAAGLDCGVKIPALPRELFPPSEGDVLYAPTRREEPAEAVPEAATEPTKPAAVAAAVSALPQPKEPQATAAVAPLAAAPQQEPDWEAYPQGGAETFVKKGTDDSLTFSFGAVLEALKRKLAG